MQVKQKKRAENQVGEIGWGSWPAEFLHEKKLLLKASVVLLSLKDFEHSTKEFELYNEPSRVF